jgi:phosphoserine aminotransferase
VNVAATMADGGFTRVPSRDEMSLNPHAAYVHITSNETIEGVQWKREPTLATCRSLRFSSDILSRELDVNKYALIYAGAQKNMGPSGVTLVIVRDDLLQAHSREPGDDARLSYSRREQVALQHAKHVGHLHHGPRLQMATGPGRPRGNGKLNDEKAQLLYDAIDATDFLSRSC